MSNTFEEDLADAKAYVRTRYPLLSAMSDQHRMLVTHIDSHAEAHRAITELIQIRFTEIHGLH